MQELKKKKRLTLILFHRGYNVVLKKAFTELYFYNYSPDFCSFMQALQRIIMKKGMKGLLFALFL